MNFKKFHVSKNLYNTAATDWTLGILDDNGQPTGSTSSHYTTNYTEVSPETAYFLSGTISTTGSLRIYFYSSDKSWISRTAQKTTGDFTTPQNCFYIRIQVTVTIENTSDWMLNTGSAPLPYEPYGNTWHDIPHYIMGTSTDTITTLPAVVYPNATTATVGLKGQAVQSSTPSPASPVMPQGTGERTGNLLPEFYATSGEISGNSYTITKNSIETHNDGSVLGTYYVLTEFRRYGNYANYAIIDEKHSFKIPAGTYTFSGNENIHNIDNGLHLIVGELGQTVAGATGGAKNIGVGQTFTINEDSYVCPVLEIRSDSQVDEYTLTNPMLNTGSTALPYEPFGVKIPISSGGVTTTKYLGEVESTRRIEKLVLDGTENWNEGTSNYYIFINISGRGEGIPNSTALSTHTESGVVVNNNGTELFFKKSVFVHSSLADFKTYLQQQYAAGTPVCVWYVLSTPTTGIVNEPLMRIGDYADTLSGITIPTIAGANAVDVLTTLKPSEVTVNYKGWHPVQNVHERDNGAWTE